MHGYRTLSRMYQYCESTLRDLEATSYLWTVAYGENLLPGSCAERRTYANVLLQDMSTYAGFVLTLPAADLHTIKKLPCTLGRRGCRPQHTLWCPHVAQSQHLHKCNCLAAPKKGLVHIASDAANSCSCAFDSPGPRSNWCEGNALSKSRVASRWTSSLTWVLFGVNAAQATVNTPLSWPHCACV